MSCYSYSPMKIRCCYTPSRTMLWVLYMLPSMFHMACGCIAEERIALRHIQSTLMEARYTVPASWGRSDNCCSWERVRCSNDSTRVLHLNFSSMANFTTAGGCWNLSMVIFSAFRELQMLDLSYNFARLEDFDGLQVLTKLRYLNLSDNHLLGRTDDIFVYLGKLVSLEVINLDRSSISGALLNTAFRNFKNLRELRLRSNQLNGSIPASLFELPLLEYLDLSTNLLQGYIPISSAFHVPPLLQTLKLSDNNLNGTFDFFWLRKCTMLNTISLSRNVDLAIDVKFHGEVPLFQLRSLMLSGCDLDKSIITGPNFLATQRHLEILDLSNNNLAGSIPNWIFTDEATLTYLNIASNSLVGSLDSMWQHKSELRVINVSMNHFEGQLPINISLLFPTLEVLDASHNNISGSIPPSLCNITTMRIMDMSSNNLTGEVPTCLFTNYYLLVLKLSNNNLRGLIFGGASNLSIAWAIYLDSNNFEGTLPSNLSGNLNIINLHDNKLSGELNPSFWNLSSLQVLNVASNSNGKIDPAICKLTNIQLLDMSDNNFSGSTPKCIVMLPLILLNLSRNSLSGNPSDFLNSSYITALDLRYNQYMGDLEWVPYLYRIKLLLLGGNMFEGQICSKICHLKHLNIIDFSHNKLSGSLPPCIGDISFGYGAHDTQVMFSISSSVLDVVFPNIDYDDLSFMFTSQYGLQSFTFSTKGNLHVYSSGFLNLMFGIDLSANMLSGEIPLEIGNLSSIKSLNLSNNFFTGQIPATIANMSAIESLDLSRNGLSGQIPGDLTRLWSLEVFSVAYNNLSGCIPCSGQFSTFNTESYMGNINLHNLSKGGTCVPSSSPIEEENLGESCEDPVLYTISTTSFVLALCATVSFLLVHSGGM
ncbi:LRR receptor-like serine/threonine-protein kinase GSO2 [Dichanthelium oligosanthes]|uniref:LRR receptor-like serine/threonine-protein kinase GSO2 n=1 Tax=Dichanthelium oligosanthes TaxID=888268 RepID=A0A1E5W0G6_9POAL|nr:LRR receptor-like serine/threonine-protein kinase GSO2 [Dichanthelium oligosanthes]